MTEKRFIVETGYHGVHQIKDKVTHKKYEFVDSEPRNLRTLCDLLNDVI